MLHHVAKYTGQLPKTPGQHRNLLHKITLLAAWVQVASGSTIVGTAMVGGLWWWRRRRIRGN